LKLDNPFKEKEWARRRLLVKNKNEAGTVQDLLAFRALPAPRGSEVQL